jgi:hypothetical protein
LALREAQLVGRRERRRLARCFERVLTEDVRRRAPSSSAPIDHDAVTVARPVLTEIILGLFSSEAVEARGVALGWRLLTDACSPLYASRGDWTYDRDRLWHEALFVLVALRPSATTGSPEPVGCPQPWAGDDGMHAQSECTLRDVSRGQ